MQDCGLEIMNVYPVSNTGKSNFISLSQGHAAFNSTSRHPDGKSFAIMITAKKTFAGAGFHHRCSAKFSSPNNQRFFEHTSLFEID